MITPDQAEQILLYLLLAVRQYGKDDILTLSDVDKSLIGFPKSPRVYVMSNGADLTVHLEAADGDVITKEDLDAVKLAILTEGKETIH